MSLSQARHGLFCDAILSRRVSFIEILRGPGPRAARLCDTQAVGTVLLREASPSGLTAYILDVTMTADFDKLAAGNWRIAHYNRWVAWLIAELPKRTNPAS